MQGSRLFILAEDQHVAKITVHALQSRMRARKLFDRYPGTQIVVHPWAEPQSPQSHADRIYVRDLLTRGSTIQNVNDVLRDWEMDEVLDEWTERQRRATVLQEHVGGWGDPYGKILMVGDSGDRPFFKTNGSRTLSKILESSGIGEAHLYFHNPYELTVDMITALSPREIVALGADAQMQLPLLGVRSFVAFPNPHHISALSSSKLEKFGELLRGTVEHAL